MDDKIKMDFKGIGKDRVDVIQLLLDKTKYSFVVKSVVNIRVSQIMAIPWSRVEILNSEKRICAKVLVNITILLRT